MRQVEASLSEARKAVRALDQEVEARKETLHKRETELAASRQENKAKVDEVRDKCCRLHEPHGRIRHPCGLCIV